MILIMREQTAMLYHDNHRVNHPLRDAITRAYREDETRCIDSLLSNITLSDDALQRIQETAKQLVNETRLRRKKQVGLDAFLHEYDLSSDEGIALMCMAEALLRIPDTETIDRLISDKISTADWQQHINQSDSMFVNAATWSLLLTGKVYAPTRNRNKSLNAALKRLFARMGSTLIRPMVLQGMKIIGKQFVMGRTIDEALERAKETEAQGYLYSYDMLGEAARTKADAENYFNSYQKAIDAIGHVSKHLNPMNGPGISIKLSALHPRYEFANREKVLEELVPRLLTLAEAAKSYNIGLTIDAEEADRLDLSLDVIEAVFCNPSLDGWEGFGLAVQSYQKRAFYVLDWLIDLAKRKQRRLMVRLIKGAYWDAEIKISQVMGFEGYPVFTRKNATDVSFIACAQKILANLDCFYPQFGTHNAYSVATILELAGKETSFEFQCLHGMGHPLYDQIVGKNHFNIPCRIYAPVGSHKDLLGYLVRRLLENGANTSFINRIADENIPVENLVIHPTLRIANLTHKPHPHIPLPRNIYGDRLNSQGLDLSNHIIQQQLKSTMDKANMLVIESGPIINGKLITKNAAQKKSVLSPNDRNIVVGHVFKAESDDVTLALHHATSAKKQWANTPVEKRAVLLEKAAEIFEKKMPQLITLLCKEGGKHVNDCISEIRETIDYCRYYAKRARIDFTPQVLKGPTGEYDELSLHPRGVILCISPWNFPLAIFMGQIVAALAAGNAVIAKPAEQTPLIAAEGIRILLEAGIPPGVIQFLPGRGRIIGEQLIRDERIDGVMFTGSTETAKHIQQSLANRAGAIVPLIAETGGQNTMIVDSSALPEQVVQDVIQSAFNSAGQRCSALRVLFIQEDIATQVISMLQGAMAELVIGDPAFLVNDVGPVIDQDAYTMLEQHAKKMTDKAKLIYEIKLPDNLPNGNYFAPRAFELKDLSLLQREVFGPILHVIRYKAHELDKVLDAIIKTGYGLTLGIHSRIDSTIEYITQHLPVGNMYVNRNMIGAVVGVQPFGGERLSGTGPKAGGPYYLPRLCVERALSINTTAAGGNATLVSLNEEE